MKKLKTVLILTACFLSFSLYTNGQVAVKTNVVMDAFRLPNLGVEIGLSKKFTLDVPVYYNPWKFSDSKQMKLFMVQPELRYWLCEKFNGHFFGAHLMGGAYHTKGIDPLFALWDDMKDYRYKGKFYGAGVSYGYQFILGNHWNLEATAGIGYARVDYEKYSCKDCEARLDKGKKNYFGPTKAAVSLIYIF